MKIYQIVSEDENLIERPVGRFKRAGQAVGRFFGSDVASGQEDISDEANNLKKQLSQWMGRSGIKKGQLTFDDLETFLNRVGYGGLAADELEKAKSQKTFGQRVKDKAKAVGAGAKAGVDAAKTAYQQASQESITEQESEFLSNAVIDRILLAVVQKASRQGGGEFQKGKFASSPKGKRARIPTDVTKILSKLPKDEQEKIVQAITKTAG